MIASGRNGVGFIHTLMLIVSHCSFFARNARCCKDGTSPPSYQVTVVQLYSCAVCRWRFTTRNCTRHADTVHVKGLLHLLSRCAANRDGYNSWPKWSKLNTIVIYHKIKLMTTDWSTIDPQKTVEDDLPKKWLALQFPPITNENSAYTRKQKLLSMF